MGPHLYFDRHGNPISQWEAARLLSDIEARRVALEYVRPGLRVSTVHIVLDHNYRDDGPPLIFETMVFEEGRGEETFWWATEEEAIQGHRDIVDSLRTVQKVQAQIEEEQQGEPL